jgi:mono/diheme cytochrome c family protein
MCRIRRTISASRSTSAGHGVLESVVPARPALCTRSRTINRGAYLATALGHCGECHTPRNLGYGLEGGREFAGDVLEGWHADNITSDKHFGVGAWSDAQLASFLSSAHAQGRGSAAGPMAEAVENSLQYLTSEDMRSRRLSAHGYGATR